MSRSRPPSILLIPVLVAFVVACSTYKTPEVKKYKWPKEAFVEEPERPHESLGQVRTKVDFITLNPEWEETKLCENYFRKAVSDLVHRAKDQGADAVMGVRSVVFTIDGRTEQYKTAECSDEGQDGQILAQGIAIRWTDVPEAARRPKRKLKPLPPLEAKPPKDEDGEAADGAPATRDRSRPVRPTDILNNGR